MPSQHCQRFLTAPVTRRDMLLRCANGFGALALTSLLTEPAFGNGLDAGSASKGTANLPSGCHHMPKAKNVIFLYMDGGPSQVDTFDPKPRLDKENGEAIKMKVPPTQFN